MLQGVLEVKGMMESLDHTRYRNLQHSTDRNIKASGVLEMRMMLPLQDQGQLVYKIYPPLALSLTYHMDLISVPIR